MVRAIPTGYGEITIFVTGICAAVIAMTFIRVGTGYSIFIVTNESITAHTATMIVAAANGIANTTVIIKLCERKIGGLLLFVRLL